MTGDGWTIDEALAEFERQGMPVDPVRFRAAVRVAKIPRAGETSSGERGGRGHALYPIAQLQRLHAALSPWLTTRGDRAGGLLPGRADDDSVLIQIRPGEHIYGPDGKLL